MNVLTAPGQRLFLTGDEAVARAALEAGVDVVTGYPGNPSTKAITALLPLARQYGFVAEWSVNEKVALEVAAGAAWAGKHSLVTMKMSGINVMADSLLSIAHSGVTGALVIYAVDDVGVYYGMVEQDSRHYAQLATLPLLMPASPEEAYAMTRRAFEVSEQCGAPVFVLATTAVANAITLLKPGAIERTIRERPAHFERNLPKFTKAVPQWCRDQHAQAIERLERAGALLADVNRAPEISRPTSAAAYKRAGVIVAGVSAAYLQEAQAHLPAELPVFKIGLVHPLPERELRTFLTELNLVLVLEELEPLIETQLAALASEAGLRVEILGKRSGLLPRVGDYSVEIVRRAYTQLLTRASYDVRDLPYSASAFERPAKQTSSAQATLAEPLPRTLEFCPGCPHRMTYYALNRAIEQLGFSKDEVITTGDIGCTIIGMNAPLDACWTEVSMGASIGIAQGLRYAGIEKPVLAAMGDGTFFHGGIAGLLNAVQSGVNLTLIILDNRRIAMTGMQNDPGSGRRSDGEPTVRADIATIVRGCGVEYVRRLDPYDLSACIEALQEAIERPGVSVIITEAPCTRRGVLIHERPVQVDQEACLAGRGCEDTPCYHKVGCPSVLLSLDELRPRVTIDSETCVACGLCVAACPFDAIKPVDLERAVLAGNALERGEED